MRAPYPVPSGWQVVPLVELADIVSGVTKGRKLDPFQVTGVPYLRVANVKAGRLELSEMKEIEVLQSDIQKYRLQAGDVLMTEGGDPDKLGRGAVWDGSIDPCIHQNHVFRVRVDRNQISPEFLVRFLGTREAKGYFLRAAKQTTGIATINSRQLKAFPVLLPPLPEQRRIAAILDKADSIRRKRQETIRLTEEFLRSTFLDMFGDPVTNPKGWPERALEDVADIRSGVTKGRGFAGKKTVHVPYMRVANVQDGRIDLDEVKEIEVLPDDVAKYALRAGDLLLTEGGDPDKLGRGGIWMGQLERCIHQNHVFCVRLKQDAELLPNYVSGLIGSGRGKRYFLRAAKQTTGIATINKTQLRAFPVLMPPLDLQQRHGALIQACAASRERTRAAMSLTDDLFASCVQRAFRGQL